MLIWTYAKINLTADTKNTILMFPLVREAIATIDTWFELKGSAEYKNYQTINIRFS